jgi:serine protease Do
VFVQGVAPNSLAAESGLQPGDVIVSANDRNVTQPSEVEEELVESRQEKRPVLLRISRQGQSLFAALDVS